MTTPSTPAGWYPDPDDSGAQRYWDGSVWTESSPATQPPASEETAVADEKSPAAQAPAEGVDDEPQALETASEPDNTIPPIPPGQPAAFEPPTFESFETPSFEEIASGALSTPEPPPPAEEAEATDVEAAEAVTPAESWPAQAAPAAQDEAPTSEPSVAPTTSTRSFAQPGERDDRETPGPWNGASFGAGLPSGQSPYGGGPQKPTNRKLLAGYLGAVGALLLVLILVLLYAFVIRDDEPTQSASTDPTTSTVEPTSSIPSDTATPSETAAAPPVGGNVTEGPFTFTVAGSETGATVTSTVDPSLTKTAVGEFVVVFVNVANTSPDVQTFVPALQVLKADGTPFPPDDEASTFVGSGVVTMNPGDVIDTAVAFDVPAGTVATAIELHGIPGGAGAELPL